MDLSLIIKEIRKHLKLSQEDFSTALGLSRSNLAQMEIGRNAPSISLLNEIVKIYHINISVVFEMINSEEKLLPKLLPKLLLSENSSEKTDKIEDKPEPILIYQRDPRDIEIIELQRNHIKLLNEKMSGDFFDGGAGSGDFAPAAPDAHTTSRHPAQFNDPTRHRN